MATSTLKATPTEVVGDLGKKQPNASNIASGLTVLTNLPKSHLPQASALHGKTFATDPAMLYFLQDLKEPERSAYLPKWIGILLKASSLNGAVFDEIWDDRQTGGLAVDSHASDAPRFDAQGQPLMPVCSAVWLPAGPGSRAIDHWSTLLPAGFGGCIFKQGIKGALRMFTFPHQSEKAKKLGLHPSRRPAGYDDAFGDKPAMSTVAKGCVDYHYLWFISTAEDQRGKGYSSTLLKRYQERVIAEGKGKPIWLESTTKQSKRVYEKCGFDLSSEWVIGKGTFGADGLSVVKGESAYKTADGIPIYAMVWWPPLPIETQTARSKE